MKYLLLLAIVVVVYLLWRTTRVRDERPSKPGAAGPQEMVSCPVCGVHLPRSEAVPDARGILYCSKEHRLRAGN
jgi:uncharacterized protein